MNPFRAYANKISRKVTGVAHLPAHGRQRGKVLLSYMTSPFTQAPGERFTDPHTNYWECAEIARLFTERGFAVDIIDAKNTAFRPRTSYAAIVDVNQNLERLAPLLPQSKKVLHITFSYGEFQNQAERTRLDALHARRGVELTPARPEPQTQSPAFADYLEGFGNSHVHGTYASFGKPIYPIPISVTKEFSFPYNKDFEKARTSFLWFGGGGAILKGLDLMVEAFAELPEYTLHLVGPAAYESEFAAAFSRELSLPNIIRHPRPKVDSSGNLHIGEMPFTSLMDQCAALIYPSASEGTSGAVIQAMHAGIVPYVTKETGIADAAPVHLLTADIVSIRTVAHSVATADPKSLQKDAQAAWEYVRAHHTRDTFSRAYATFIDTVLFP